MGNRHIERTDGDIFDPKATAPTATEGSVYYNSTTHTLYFRNASAWVDVAAGIPDASPTVSGQVTYSAQSFGGLKTFSDGMYATAKYGVAYIGGAAVMDYGIWSNAGSAYPSILGSNTSSGEGVRGD